MSVGKILSRNENKIGKITFPNDWSIYKLSDILKLVKRPIKMEDQKFYNLVTIKRRFGGMVKRERLRGNQIQVKSQFSVKSGDFVISKRQISHGACAIVPEKLDGSIVSNEYNILRNKENLDLEFFNWYVQLPFMQRYFYLSSDGVHIEKLLFKLEDWLQRKVCIPEVKEQKKIAKIISTWDKAIELKEKLIEQKKQQKKGLMQKLLTGEVRLPSFDKEWKEVKLAELGECIRGVSYKPEDLYLEDNNNSIRLLRSNNILGNTLVIKDIQFVDKSKVKKKQLLKKTDVVISMANGSKKLVGKNGVFNSKSNYFYTVGAFCAIFRFNQKSSANFAKFLFQTNKYNYYVQNLLAGSNINNLKPSDIESMKFFIPTEIKEQNEIAKVLDSASNEINVLEKELEALKQQKKGLMQLLLTGKVRVKV